MRIQAILPLRRSYVRWHLLKTLYIHLSMQHDTIGFSHLRIAVESSTDCPTKRTVLRELLWLEEQQYVICQRKRKQCTRVLPDGRTKAYEENIHVSLTEEGKELCTIAYFSTPTDLAFHNYARQIQSQCCRRYNQIVRQRSNTENQRIYN